MIVASGSFKVDGNTITVDPSLTHNEQVADFSGGKVTITVKTTSGTTKTFDLTDNGSYLLNLQNDTLIGGIVNYGSTERPGSIGADQLNHIIDSTKQLIAGQNASDERKTYFVPPFTIKKVSAQDNAKIIGSFNGIPHDNDADGSGKAPEVYKFFTTKQKREKIEELEKEQQKLKSVG